MEHKSDRTTATNLQSTTYRWYLHHPSPRAHCPAPRARRKCACTFRLRGAPHARSRRSALLPAGQQPWRRCIKSCQVRLPPRAPPPCAPPPHRNCSRTPRCPAPRARRKCACAFRPRGAPHARSGCSALLPARRQPWAPMQQELPGAPPPRPPVRRLCPRPPVRGRHTATVAAHRNCSRTPQL